jgi:glycosyltransferase involved in cell wall biosynthesis
VPEQPWVSHDAERLGIGEWVRFARSDHRSPELVDLCDLVVVISRMEREVEHWLLPRLDGAPRGIPIVGFATHDIADLLADGGGLVVVPYLDTDALADAVLGLVEDEDRYEEQADALVRRLRARRGVGALADRVEAELRRVTT